MIIQWVSLVLIVLIAGVFLRQNIRLGREISRLSTTKGRQTEPSTGSIVTDTGILSAVKSNEARLDQMEVEWADMRTSLSRLAGRISKTAALDNPRAAAPESPAEVPVNRHEIAARAHAR